MLSGWAHRPHKGPYRRGRSEVRAMWGRARSQGCRCLLEARKARTRVSMKPLESASPARGLDLGLQNCRTHLCSFEPLVCDVLL